MQLLVMNSKVMEILQTCDLMASILNFTESSDQNVQNIGRKKPSIQSHTYEKWRPLGNEQIPNCCIECILSEIRTKKYMNYVARRRLGQKIQ